MGTGYKRWGIDWEKRVKGGWCKEVHEEEEGLEDHLKKQIGVSAEWRGSERGKQKERRKREGEHVVKEERGRWVGGEVWPVRDTWRKRRRRSWRGEKGERNRAHGHRKSGALHSHAKSSDGVFTPRRCRNQTHPSSLQVTATNNKQLFTCWTRVGAETKVFCQCSKCAVPNKCTVHSELIVSTDTFIILIFPNDVTFYNGRKPGQRSMWLDTWRHSGIYLNDEP